MRREMRRRAALLLSACGLLAASALGATPASADEGTATDAGGWQRVDAQLMEELLAEAGAEETASALAAGDEESEILPWAIQSSRNGRFVAAELRYSAPNTGALRARSALPSGAWEDFDLVWDEASESITLRSLANGRYVATERNYPGTSAGLLRARSATVGGWERFWLYWNEETGTYAFQSWANGLFVAMEYTRTGTLQYALRSRSEWINGSWEEFWLY
ncbi:hypothetical protein RM780_26935 [Streptomyces sp. DSM 44917]|uniref:Uncharacterized protein n=1 Tax=Streptomyces boetiae TaxID=3075541 RepID=A0ABU2LG41_9ACTN|nr:hypothetical protein [Streptomyces sp. DSM 44917]MDT0310555.1 hypothetical protein [Streptomyces sp. DSM 44917]